MRNAFNKSRVDAVSVRTDQDFVKALLTLFEKKISNYDDKEYTLGIYCYIIILGVRVFSQSVTVDAKIDSLQILIGEQARIRLQVSFNAKQKAIFPIYTDTLIKGVDIVEIAKPDTQYLNNKEVVNYTRVYNNVF